MKKKKAENEEKQEEEKKKPKARFTDFLAFLALAAAGILFLVGPVLLILPEGSGGPVAHKILSMTAQYCLLAAVALPGWAFVRNKGNGWKIAYFLFLLLYIAGSVLGVTLSL